MSVSFSCPLPLIVPDGKGISASVGGLICEEERRGRLDEDNLLVEETEAALRLGRGMMCVCVGRCV